MDTGRFRVSLTRWLLVCAVVVALGPAAWAAGALHGHARFEKIKGRPDLGYVEMYEYKAFLSPNGNGTGYSYHCGDPGSAQHPGTGCYIFPSVVPGTYSVLTVFPEFFPRGKVVSNVVIADGPQTERNADQPIDYSGYLNKNEWDPIGGTPIYQTFVATGTSISRVSFAKADNNNTGSVLFSIHESNGGNVETWSQVGPTRGVNRGGYGGDHWVGWQAGEVTTVPGRTYAIKLASDQGIGIQPYWCQDSLYPQGTGYRGTQSNPAGRDYYIVVFSDNDNTIATLQIRSSGYGNLAGDVFREKFAQSYTARGSSLAAAALMTTIGGSGGWNFAVKVSVHSQTPNGPQVGPAKTMPNAFAPFFGVSGVAFNPGEVPTTVGQTYWIVYERPNGAGFNASRMNEGNLYAGGTGAYQFGGTWTDLPFDLCMDIFEYAGTNDTPTPGPSPTPTNTPVPGENILTNGSFEQSSGMVHPGWTNDTEVGTNGLFPDPRPAKDGFNWASFSYGGGQTAVHELYQTLDVTPGVEYHLVAWADVGGTNGSAAAYLMWYDGEYPGKGNGVPVDSLLWTYPDDLIDWTELSGTVTPSGSTLTFVLRIEIVGWGGGVNFDSCMLVEQSSGCANDTDNDGVCDEEEDLNSAVGAGHSNILLADSDGDGLADGEEDANRNGVQDAGETSTRNRDTDGDRYLDGLDPSPLSPNAGFTDADSDELHDASDPNSSDADSDDDGFRDGYEAAVGGSASVINAGLVPRLGDCNKDGFVSNVDALIAQSLFLGNIVPGNPVFQGDGFSNGDANRDGFISNVDALIFQSFFIGTVPLLPL